MSLTGMLKSKDSKSIELKRIIKSVLPKKNEFYTLSGLDAFNNQALPVSPYNKQNLKFAAITGTAIELIAKYYIGRNTKFKHKKWEARTTGLASSGLEFLQDTLTSREFNLIYEKYEERYAFIKDYVDDKSDNIDDLIISAVLSSKLENCVRSLRLPENPLLYFTEEVPKSVHDDLFSLFQGFISTFVDNDILKNTTEIDFHPIFGRLSKAVGGADADLYIDGTLYDFKTSKNRGYEWQEIAQLIGYSLFSDISSDIFELDLPGYTNEFPYKVNRIAFYRTRFNEIEYFNIEEIPLNKWQVAKSEVKGLFNIKY